MLLSIFILLPVDYDAKAAPITAVFRLLGYYGALDVVLGWWKCLWELLWFRGLREERAESTLRRRDERPESR